MSQISPKQIDWSQSISGSLLPYVSGSGSISDFTLGGPSASWGAAYIDGIQVSGSIGAGDGDFDEILVRNKTELRTQTIITGSVKISGSLEVDGVTTLRSGLVNTASLNVEGQLNVLNQQINSSVEKAKITIQNLGEIGDRDEDLVLDLGGFF
jgi:hypothetical protein